MLRVFLPGLLIILALCATPVLAVDFQTGVDAYTQGDYDTAQNIFQELARQGHTDAQNNLGVMYNTGKGVGQDNAEAARWYRMAAERGHADAQSNLASLYVTGRGVPQDYVRAYAWFNLAAEQGDKSAASNRDFVANRLSPEDLREAQQLSLMTSPADAAPAAPAAPASVAAAAPAPTAPAPTAPAPTAPAPAAAAPVSPPPAAAPAPTRPPAPATRPAPESAVAMRSPAPDPRPERAPTTRPAPVQRPAAPAANVERGYYGPVSPGSTLWSIAKAVKPDPSITTQQMVLALQRANPEAFSRPNINFLRVGARLRIPPLAEIRRIDPASAKAEVDRQLGN